MSEGGSPVTRTSSLRLPLDAQPSLLVPVHRAVPAVPPLERTEPLAQPRPEPVLDSAAVSFAREREHALTRSEHSWAVRRLRRALILGVSVWAGSTVLDLYVTQFAHEGDLKLFLILQGVGTLVVLGLIARLYSPREPSARALWACDAMASTAVAALASLESLAFRGIDSPYAAGIIVIMLARATTTFSPWRQGALLFGAPALVYPLIVAVAALIDDRIAAQLRDPAALSGFFCMLFFIATSWLMLMLGGHYVWRLRRDAAEARNIGRYRIEHRLGSGGMADVWSAFDLTLQLRVAVKTMAGNRRDPGSLARFQREVRALAELKHPNTVRVLDYGVTDDGLWYYTMELLEGENLRELVVRTGPQPIGRIAHIACQVLGALGEAHRKGFVHRDIKPDNVFLAQFGGELELVKLLDFGVATVAADPSLTNAGQVIGTPAYMAPELSSGCIADVRSDIYSFGVLLYYLASARLPFPDQTCAALLAAHLGREPEPLAHAESPPALQAFENVVRTCMAKDPDARYHSTHEVIEALRAVPV